MENKEKETLIQNIWIEKKGRVDSSPHALYVAISSPNPDLRQLTKLVLDEISNPANAKTLERWARGWDRVVICVRPGGGQSCSLGLTDDDKNKSFVPVSTNRKIATRKFLEEMPEGDLGTITLNNNPTTTEAFLISYIHMLNELVWDIYRFYLQEAGVTLSPDLYIKAVETVKEKGFSLAQAVEEDLLTAKKINPKVSIRLYGSGVNKDVSKVMGAVFSPTEPKVSGDRFMDKLGCNTENLQKELNDTVVAQKPSVPVVFSSVTFGKELHAGHMLLLATADLLRLGLGGQSISIINNNTGPRAAGVLVKLSRDLNLSLKDSAELLDSGQVPADNIIEAYRNRVEKDLQLQDAFELLDSGAYDIFALMSRKIRPKLAEAGFLASIVAESENLARNQEIIESINPVWRNSGFMFSADKGVKILRKNGQLTASGKVISYLAGLAEEPLARAELPFLVFVDGSGDAIDAANTYSQFTGLGKAMQMAGAGIGFDGKIASGSKGEALTLTELLAEFQRECPEGQLCLALRQFVLTRPMTMPTQNMGESFYDFKDNTSFVKVLAECFEEAVTYRQRTLDLIGNLRSKVGDYTDVSKIDAKFFEFLPKKADALFNTSFEDIVLGMSRSKNLGVMDVKSEMDGFDKLGHGLNRVVRDRPLIDNLIMEALLSGRSRASSITEFARQRGLPLPPVVFGKDFPVKNMILEAVLKQGYTGGEAINRAKVYSSGNSRLAVRGNLFLGTAKSIVRLEGRMLTLSPRDFALIEKILKFSLGRLGYEI